MSDEKKQGSLLGQAWLVLCLAIVFGGGLAFVEIGLGPQIRANQKQETFGQVASLVPGATAEKSDYTVVGPAKVIEAKDAAGALKGWIVPAQGAGFADTIKILIGLNADASRITGIYVLQQAETPGLGDFITDEGKFRRWYRNQKTATPLAVVKGEPEKETGRIKALSGATISSVAVTNIVNQRVKAFRAELFARNS